MRTFDYSKLNCIIDNEIMGYIAKIHEYKGRQQLFISQKKEKLEKLVEIAKIQSTESSNKIEGIVTTNTRIKQLVQEKTAPKNRDEKEIMGYRDVLNIIHENFEYIPITPSYILQLHKYLYQYSNPDFGGKFKNTQNYIVANLPDGTSNVLFEPLSPIETPIAMEQLCDTFNKAMSLGEIDSLLLISNFIKTFCAFILLMMETEECHDCLQHFCFTGPALLFVSTSVWKRKSKKQKTLITMFWKKTLQTGRTEQMITQLL